MSCARGQNAAAGQPSAAAGINRKASKNGNAAGSGAAPAPVPRKKQRTQRRPRKVRQAIKAYQKLPLAKKEKLWKAMGQAALEKGDDKRRLRRLSAATRAFGPGVVAAAVATEIQKAKKEGDTWTQERYQKLADMLPKAAKATKKAELSTAKTADSTTKTADAAISQKSFFQKSNSAGKGNKSQTAQQKIKLDGVFSPGEIQQIWLQLSFGGAAARRHMKMLSGSHSRGHTHTDPRESDWVQQDNNNFAFLSNQLRQIKNGGGSIDTSSLGEAELVDLWEFSRFEADRAHRNIDHLQAGLSHLKSESAGYFSGRHKLEARFFTFLANELEPAITTAMRDRHGSVEV